MRNSSCEASAIRGLAAHATSPLPAWLWSIDGTRILWANPVGASVFGASQRRGALRERVSVRPTRTGGRSRSSRDGCRRPAQLRLERLRGFGAAAAALVTCGCARLDFADGSHGILIAAAEPSAARCRWSNGCNVWSRASIRRSPHLPATACWSAPATPRVRCSDSAISPTPAWPTPPTTR